MKMKEGKESNVSMERNHFREVVNTFSGSGILHKVNEVWALEESFSCEKKKYQRDCWHGRHIWVTYSLPLYRTYV